METVSKEDIVEYFKYDVDGRMFNRKYRSQSIEVLPGVYSKTPEYLSFLVATEDACKKEWPDFNWTKLLTLPGSISEPRSAPAGQQLMYDEYKIKKLSKDDRDDFITYLKFIRSLFEINWTPKVRIEKNSSSGFPFFLTGSAKLDRFNHNLKRAIAGEGIEEDVAPIYNMAYLVQRLQPDGGKWNGSFYQPKNRYVISDDVKLVQAQNRYHALEEGIDFTFAKMRSRVAYAFPDYITSRFKPIGEAYRNFFMLPIFKNRGYKYFEDRANQIKGHYVVKADATNFDWFVSEEMICLILEYFYVELSDKLKQETLEMYKIDVFAPGTDNHETKVYLNRPFNGLLSGVWNTPDAGRLIGSFFLQFRHFKKLFGIKSWHSIILQQSSDVICWNSSDDNWNKFRDLAAFNDFKYLIDKESDYFDVSIEEDASYNGMQSFPGSYYNRGQDTIITPNLTSYFINFLVPERGITSLFRKYAIAIGYEARNDIYREFHPDGEKAIQLLDDLILGHLKFRLSDVASRAASFLPKDINVAIKSQADLEVLLEPSKIYWKFEPSDISEHILNETTTLMDQDLVNAYLDLVKKNKI